MQWRLWRTCVSCAQKSAFRSISFSPHHHNLCQVFLFTFPIDTKIGFQTSRNIIYILGFYNIFCKTPFNTRKLLLLLGGGNEIEPSIPFFPVFIVLLKKDKNIEITSFQDWMNL